MDENFRKKISSMGIDDIRIDIFNFTVIEFCEFLEIKKTTYYERKKKGFIESYRNKVIKLFSNPECIIKSIEKQSKILEMWINQPLYMKIRDDLNDEHLTHFFEIFKKSDNQISKVQCAIFIGRVGVNRRLVDEATFRLLQMKDMNKCRAISLGIDVGLVLVKYERVYPHFFDRICDKDCDDEHISLIKNFYNEDIWLLKSSAIMLNAQGYAEGYTFFSIALLYLFRHRLKAINEKPSNLTNYIPVLQRGFTDLKIKPLYINKTDYQDCFKKIISEIEKALE